MMEAAHRAADHSSSTDITQSHGQIRIAPCPQREPHYWVCASSSCSQIGQIQNGRLEIWICLFPNTTKYEMHHDVTVIYIFMIRHTQTHWHARRHTCQRAQTHTKTHAMFFSRHPISDSRSGEWRKIKNRILSQNQDNRICQHPVRHTHTHT